MDKISVRMQYLRSTKRTHVFGCDNDPTTQAHIETLYISKTAFSGVEPPKTILVEVKEG